MTKFLILTALAFTFSSANAHEGHDKTPGALVAPHGGILKGVEHIYVELVTEPKGLKIYPLDHNMKAIPLSDVKIEGKMSVPRKKQSDAVKFVSEADHFSSKIDAKGAHRYDLDLTVVHGGKLEKIKFSVEPQ